MVRKAYDYKGWAGLLTSLAGAVMLLGGCLVTPVVNVANMTPSEWAALSLDGQVTGVDMSKGTPIVRFKVTDANGSPVVGLAANTSKSVTATVAGYPNLAITLAKLVPASNGSPSKWVSYFVTSVPTTTATVQPNRPVGDTTGTLVDNGDGTYVYTAYRDVTKVKAVVAGMTVTAPNDVSDLGDLTYDPTLTHRLVVQLAGNARGTGNNTPNAVVVTPGVPIGKAANLVYDFIPATGKVVAATDMQREIVKVSACLECHGEFAVHGGGRQDPRYCVTCHTDQRKYGYAEAIATASGYSGTTNKISSRAVGEFTNFMHKLHMGEGLGKSGYSYGGLLFNEIRYPQDQRNCVKCHDGSATANNQTAQGDNWKRVPSRVACGACHDKVDFATGANHSLGGARADDKTCALCHDADAIAAYHVPVTPIAATILAGNVAIGNTNAASIAAYTRNLPTGAAKISYAIGNVVVDSNRNPVVQFKVLKDGAAVVFNTYSATGKTELMDGFIGSPSVNVVFAVPQDGIAAPADFNAAASVYLKNLWNGTAAATGTGTATGTGNGTLSGPDANGFYTVTMTGVIIPTTASMVTAGINYTYNLSNTFPLTQINLPAYPYNATTRIGGLIVPGPNVWKVATGYTGRRILLDNARCNKCHEVLGVFTTSAYHAGQRNDAASCSFCHSPNRTSNGWSASSGSLIHGIHGASKRTVQFSYRATSATDGYWNVGYPGVLKNCEQCHLPDTYNFGGIFSQSANTATALMTTFSRTNADNMLYSTVGQGTYQAIPLGLSPYVSAGINYGGGFAFNVATGIATEAEAGTLVNSPISSACFSCHDSATALAHMRANGGSIYALRSSALATRELCLQCHAAGMLSDVKLVHGL